MDLLSSRGPLVEKATEDLFEPVTNALSYWSPVTHQRADLDTDNGAE